MRIRKRSALGECQHSRAGVRGAPLAPRLCAGVVGREDVHQRRLRAIGEHLDCVGQVLGLRREPDDLASSRSVLIATRSHRPASRVRSAWHRALGADVPAQLALAILKPRIVGRCPSRLSRARRPYRCSNA